MEAFKASAIVSQDGWLFVSLRKLVCMESPRNRPWKAALEAIEPEAQTKAARQAKWPVADELSTIVNTVNRIN